MNYRLLETILNQRYGSPVSLEKGDLIEKTWTKTNPDVYSILYYEKESYEDVPFRYAKLQEIYGDSIGGVFLGSPQAGGYLKISLLKLFKMFHLYNIDDFLERPEIQYALTLDPEIDFFMNAANVWFYGYKQGELYVYDSGFDELDSLGPVEAALETLLDEWEGVREDVFRRG